MSLLVGADVSLPGSPLDAGISVGASVIDSLGFAVSSISVGPVVPSFIEGGLDDSGASVVVGAVVVLLVVGKVVPSAIVGITVESSLFVGRIDDVGAKVNDGTSVIAALGNAVLMFEGDGAVVTDGVGVPSCIGVAVGSLVLSDVGITVSSI